MCVISLQLQTSDLIFFFKLNLQNSVPLLLQKMWNQWDLNAIDGFIEPGEQWPESIVSGITQSIIIF